MDFVRIFCEAAYSGSGGGVHVANKKTKKKKNSVSGIPLPHENTGVGSIWERESIWRGRYKLLTSKMPTQQ